MKIGLIGCGKQAPKHLSGLTTQDDTQIVLADLMPERAKALAAQQGLSWVENIEDIFADPSISAVVITTPTSSHAALIHQSIEAGKSFFCEKPLCENAQEARAIAAQMAQAKIFGVLGFVYRFAPVFEAARELCAASAARGQEGALGPLVTGLFRIGGRGSHQIWKHRLASGGGAINEMMVHMLDLAVWFFGDIREARLLDKGLLRPERKINGAVEKVDAEDFIIARLYMQSGIEVVIQADLVTPSFSQLIEIQGENGSFRGSIESDIPAFVHCSEAAGGYPAGRTYIDVPSGNLFQRQMEAFVAAVREGRPPAQCRLEDSVMVMEAMEQLHRDRPN